jgi:hypothetical protein
MLGMPDEHRFSRGEATPTIFMNVMRRSPTYSLREAMQLTNQRSDVDLLLNLLATLDFIASVYPSAERPELQ